MEADDGEDKGKKTKRTLPWEGGVDTKSSSKPVSQPVPGNVPHNKVIILDKDGNLRKVNADSPAAKKFMADPQNVANLEKKLDAAGLPKAKIIKLSDALKSQKEPEPKSASAPKDQEKPKEQPASGPEQLDLSLKNAVSAARKEATKEGPKKDRKASAKKPSKPKAEKPAEKPKVVAAKPEPKKIDIDPKVDKEVERWAKRSTTPARPASRTEPKIEPKKPDIVRHPKPPKKPENDWETGIPPKFDAPKGDSSTSLPSLASLAKQSADKRNAKPPQIPSKQQQVSRKFGLPSLASMRGKQKSQEPQQKSQEPPPIPRPAQQKQPSFLDKAKSKASSLGSSLGTALHKPQPPKSGIDTDKAARDIADTYKKLKRGEISPNAAKSQAGQASSASKISNSNIDSLKSALSVTSKAAKDIKDRDSSVDIVPVAQKNLLKKANIPTKNKKDQDELTLAAIATSLGVKPDDQIEDTYRDEVLGVVSDDK